MMRGAQPVAGSDINRRGTDKSAIVNTARSEAIGRDMFGVIRRSRKKLRLGIWLGALALAVQTYLPIHLFLLAAGACASIEAASHVVHHDHAMVHATTGAPRDGGSGEHHGTGHSHCPICSMQMQAATAFMLPAGPEPDLPTTRRSASAPALASHEFASPSPASYASRALPSSIG